MPVRYTPALLLTSVSILLAVQAAHAQTYEVLFPGLTGEGLREEIAATYAPVSVLSLEQSKDTLYAVIDRETRGGLDGASGIYTDYFVAFDCVPNCDPSQDVYDGGSGLSQEHTWPRSEGADSGLFERDLHHLYPSRNSVNSARGNLPFGESPDGETSTWYYLDQTRTTPPPEPERDLWSERLGSTLFEPREGREGDVARAMFYAYAVYGPDGNGQANAAFWGEMRPYLLGWHRADLPSAEDQARSERVSWYQVTGSGAPAVNPFVVDTSLAARAFYPETLPTAAEPPVATEAPLTLELAGPNPFRDRTALALTLAEPAHVRVEVFDGLGRRVAIIYSGQLGAGAHTLALNSSRWALGFHVVRATSPVGSAALTVAVVR